MVSSDTAGMAAGDYYCELTIFDACDPNLTEVVPVSLHVQGPLIHLSTEHIEFVALEGGADPNDLTLMVTNAGGGILNWQIADDCNWASIDANSGSLVAYESNDVTISVDKAGLHKGDYYCELTVSDARAENSPQVVAVHLEVVGPILSVTPSYLKFPIALGEPNVYEQVLSIGNNGGGTLNWQITPANDCDWLGVYPLTGQSRGEVNKVTVSVDTSGLGLGFYDCQLTISDSNVEDNPQVLPVMLHIYVPGELHVPAEYVTIQEAIDAAQEHQTVVLETGTYDEAIDFGGKNVTLTSIGPNDPVVVAATVIDTGGVGPAVTFSGGELGSCRLVGLTITGGTYGVYCELASPTIHNCVVAGNLGPGIRCVNSDPVITGCQIIDNAGHGISLNSHIANNYAGIAGCRIVGNNGRGIDSYMSQDVISNCLIAGNKGQGVYSYRSRMLTIKNSTIVGNTGEGVYCDPSKMTIINCILWDNASGPGWQIHSPAGGYLLVEYSDIQGGWSGNGNIDCDPCFARAGYWGDANDPNIVAEANDPNAIWVGGDYHLKSFGWRWVPQVNDWRWDEVTSRCVDGGNPGSALAEEPLSVPLDPDNVWGCNIRVNIGFYAGTAEASLPPYDWALLADLSNDGTVNFADVGLWAENWLAGGSELSGDLDRSGVIDLTDFALLGGDWSSQPIWHEGQ